MKKHVDPDTRIREQLVELDCPPYPADLLTKKQSKAAIQIWQWMNECFLIIRLRAPNVLTLDIHRTLQGIFLGLREQERKQERMINIPAILRAHGMPDFTFNVDPRILVQLCIVIAEYVPDPQPVLKAPR